MPSCATSRTGSATDADDARPTCCRNSTSSKTRVGKVVVPLSHADELYALRNHIDLIRQKLSR